MKSLNNFFQIFFVVLSILCFIGGRYVEGICIWLSLLTLAVWPILAANLLMGVIQLFTKKKWRCSISLFAILLHTNYLLAVYQLPFWNQQEVADSEGTPLTVVTYNTSHFYWGKKYTMNEAAAYIKELQPDIVCFQEAPGDGYYHRDSIRYAFDYVLYKYISRRTDHLPTTIYSRYPIHSVKALYYENSQNMSLIADVRINNQYIRVINNHFETTSVNAYIGRIIAPNKEFKIRMKAIKELFLQMNRNNRKRADQANTIRTEIENSPYPVLVCGDFNDTPASYAYHQVRKGLTDGFRECGSGYQYTFRQLYKLWRIDYIFYSESLKGRECYSPETSYSDHNMVVWKGFVN
ncbi:endonuclease/exonuclease/phosphatase family protein [Parabacteroides chongii]|uniref:endonuclease/exonuclease/phosphatase family protein n=1 Tax=Parabacteroides chongii TaxID=2685834 RepID=UPI00240D49EA|nr:endonuclease/exonuclease/phosphatase family protein [Parabacteroides chongii]WFE83982.1 endonuclease/exonuclease/phosphatase family protein [Parabacteroides chongii]